MAVLASNEHFHDLLGDEDRHIIVDATPRQDNLRVIAKLFGASRQIVRIDADAMSADQSG